LDPGGGAVLWISVTSDIRMFLVRPGLKTNLTTLGWEVLRKEPGPGGRHFIPGMQMLSPPEKARPPMAITRKRGQG